MVGSISDVLPPFAGISDEISPIYGTLLLPKHSAKLYIVQISKCLKIGTISEKEKFTRM